MYLGLLREVAEEARCTVHAYVLMTNHVHLLVTPFEVGGCSVLMKHVAQRHAQHCNREWVRTGPLWESRFKDSLIDSATYGLSCLRYIERNPVRAGMVRHPAAYPWSSFGANAMGVVDPMLVALPEFLALAPDSTSRRRIYRDMFDVPEAEDVRDRIRAALHAEIPLGSEAFLDEIERASGRRFPKSRKLVEVRRHQHGAKRGLTPV